MRNDTSASLQLRLVLATSVVLVVLLSVCALALDRAFRDGALSQFRQRLEVRVFAMLAAAEPDPALPGAMRLSLADPAFSRPGSGLYAKVVDGRGTVLWRSQSLLGLDVQLAVPDTAGTAAFDVARTSDGQEVYAYALRVEWEFAAGVVRSYVFQTAESSTPFNEQVRQFRQRLAGWLAAAVVVLLAVQGVILRWSLAPLKRVAVEVAQIETGEKLRLADDYPRELRPLTSNLNALIDSSRRHLERYRNSLGDLAHSLKTPLAVLRGAAEADMTPAALRTAVAEQVTQMNQTVEFRLQRAAAAGAAMSLRPVDLAALAARVRQSLLKVYAGKQLDFQLKVIAPCMFSGDESDFAEILGNLADNACKWCSSQVRLTITQERKRPGVVLVISIEDDGPGIPEDGAARIGERGVRVDSAIPGFGIGLSMVAEIVTQIYAGAIHIDHSELGGARVVVRLDGVV